MSRGKQSPNLVTNHYLGLAFYGKEVAEDKEKSKKTKPKLNFHQPNQFQMTSLGGKLLFFLASLGRTGARPGEP